MKLIRTASCAALLLAVTGISPAAATTITFDDAINGATSYEFDADSDGQADARFSTSDPFGFDTAGPGPNQLYIDEPGLEGTTLLNPDLRVDFLVGAEGALSFGYAVSDFGDVANAVLFSIFDSANTLLASISGDAAQGSSSFAEGYLSLGFSGVAAYATFDFSDQVVGGRYIIDNFEGTFGTVERGIPEPSVWVQLIAGFGLIGAALRSGRRVARATA